MIEGRYETETGKRQFVRDLFNRGARHYDRIGTVGFLGTGSLYRRLALQRAGLVKGMRVLDVACGTGAVTREISKIVADPTLVWGADPTPGMLAVAHKGLEAQFVQGRAEELPFENGVFDFLSMGYALRHVADLSVAFREYRRVLRPGGRLLLLEITRPERAWVRFLAWMYFGIALPPLSFLITGSRDASEMMSYYWETIDACVPPHTILGALEQSGFKQIHRRVELGIFSAYGAVRD